MSRNSSFFSKSLVARRKAPKAWILAWASLPSSTLCFHTRSRPFVQRPRAFVWQTNAKNTTVLQSKKQRTYRSRYFQHVRNFCPLFAVNNLWSKKEVAPSLITMMAMYHYKSCLMFCNLSQFCNINLSTWEKNGHQSASPYLLEPKNRHLTFCSPPNCFTTLENCGRSSSYPPICKYKTP